MVDQLSAFASEVTRVALEVGTQGILGGQAKVEGVQGTWADLTRNVNVGRFSFLFIFASIGFSDDMRLAKQKMASNLTDQVRSISEVTKAVALGDLRKLVDVDVQGEMLDLKVWRSSFNDFFLLTHVLLLTDDRQLDGGAAEYPGQRGDESEFGSRD